MVAKIHWIGSLKRFKVQIFIKKDLFLEAYTKTFVDAMKIVEKFKGGRQCVK